MGEGFVIQAEAMFQQPMEGVRVGQLIPLRKGASHLALLTKYKLACRGPGQAGEEAPQAVTQGHASPLPQVLISADDEMEESDVEEDLRRLTPLRPAKKKKHRFGLPV